MDLPDRPQGSPVPARYRWLLLVTLLVATGGCSWSAAPWPQSGRLPGEGLSQGLPLPDPASTAITSHEGGVPPRDHGGESAEAILAEQSHWIRAVNLPGGPPPPERWVYPNLGDLLADTSSRQVDLRRFLTHSNPAIAANAAIGLGRSGDPTVNSELADSICNPGLSAALRSAAAETLARLPSPRADLERLLDLEAAKADQLDRGYSATVHAELVRALGRHGSPGEEPRLADALAASADEVKLAALAVWQEAQGCQLPEEALRLLNHHDPRVRAEAAAALACHPDDRTFDRLTQAASDPDPRVRSAAILALGAWKGAEAHDLLRRVMHSGTEGDRIAAVAALAAAGRADDVLAAAVDKAWRVRQAVARSLWRFSDESAAKVARELIVDPSAEVQYQAVAAIRSWPRERARPLLIDALQFSSHRCQVLAIELLMADWPEGRDLLQSFPLGRPPRLRAEAAEAIRKACCGTGPADESVGKGGLEGGRQPPPERIAAAEAWLRLLASDQVDAESRREAVEHLAGFGPDLVDVLEHLAIDRGLLLPEAAYRPVLAGPSPAFSALAGLESDDVQHRRRAAQNLVDVFSHEPPRPLVLDRIARLAIDEPDSLVWAHLLTALAGQGDPWSFRLVYAALGHSSPEIRRRACEHLQRHPAVEHVPPLLPALEDESPSVVRAAVRALGHSGGQFDPAPLVGLLRSGSEPLKAEAAEALTRLGRAEGFAALERLAYSSNEHVRLRVAQAMGEAGDPIFTPSLIRLLDDRHGIRLAALESLAKVNAHAAPTAALAQRSEGERIEAWKRWAAHPEDAVQP